VPGASWFDALDSSYADDGGICAVLAAMQEEGLSYKKMAARILDEKGFCASPSALQRYVVDKCADV
jgi:hypothetical protein